MAQQPPRGTKQPTGPTIDKDDARAGQTPGVVRYMLAISLALIVIIFALLFGLSR